MWMLRLVGALAEFVGDVPGKNIHDAGVFAAARDDDIRKFHIIGKILTVTKPHASCYHGGAKGSEPR